jgi:hypothetical protein
MTMDRRSFLSLLASSLAFPPEKFLGPGPPQATTPDSADDDRWDVWTYSILNTFTIEPHLPTYENALIPPLPKNFVVTQIGWASDPRTAYRDLMKIMDEIGYHVWADGRERMSGAVAQMPFNFGVGVHRWTDEGKRKDPRRPVHLSGPDKAPEYPFAIAPMESFRLELEGRALELERRAELYVIVGGLVRIDKVER